MHQEQKKRNTVGNYSDLYIKEASWNPEAGLNDELVRWIGLGIQNAARFQSMPVKMKQNEGYPSTHCAS